MDEDTIIKIAKKAAQQVYDQNTTQGQFSNYQVPVHVHNGSDSRRLSQDNIEAGTYATTSLKSITSEIFTIETFPNIDTISLHGIASDGQGRKAHLNGNAAIGKCFQYGVPSGNVSYIPLIGGTYSDIIQSSSNIYVDTSTTVTMPSGYPTISYNQFLLSPSGNAPAVIDVNWNNSVSLSTTSKNTRVGATGWSGSNTVPSYLVYVQNQLAAVVASMTIISWTDTTITFQTTLATKWSISFYLTMS